MTWKMGQIAANVGCLVRSSPFGHLRLRSASGLSPGSPSPTHSLRLTLQASPPQRVPVPTLGTILPRSCPEQGLCQVHPWGLRTFFPVSSRDLHT